MTGVKNIVEYHPAPIIPVIHPKTMPAAHTMQATFNHSSYQQCIHLNGFVPIFSPLGLDAFSGEFKRTTLNIYLYYIYSHYCQ